MRGRAPARRPSTAALGRAAEQRARRHLESLGFTILAANLRNRAGEVDLVAREGDVLCFVEVRSRTKAEEIDPLETIGRDKRRRIGRAAEVYLAGLSGTPPPVRFDIVAVRGECVELLRNAFETD